MVKRKREGNHSAATKASVTNGKAPKIVKTNGHVDVKTSSPVNGIKPTSVKASDNANIDPTGSESAPPALLNKTDESRDPSHTIQIVTGSYESTLHGITASITTTSGPAVQFSDTFLFNAHSSSIRSLALSPLPPPDSAGVGPGVYLATGGSDERINLYSLSASPLPPNARLAPLPTLSATRLSENPANRELGAIVTHNAPVTALYFPSRSKLLSGSEDNTIAVTRTRDLEVVSSIKAPRPKVQGQPSGDTAPVGLTPMGINGFTVHPSMKLMLTVSKGERCMRLWNLVTGKKAGVLNFDKRLLESIKEGKHSSGEGRRIRWNGKGTEFAVAFERGVVVFGEDSRPKCKFGVVPVTKVHQIAYVQVGEDREHLAMSTEDGRIVFYDLDVDGEGEEVPEAKVVAQLGGREAGVNGRIKDFEILKLETTSTEMLVVTASSDGAVRVWQMPLSQMPEAKANDLQMGNLIGTYETGNRITCLRAFVMQPPREEDEGGFSEFEGLTSQGEESSESDGDED